MKSSSLSSPRVFQWFSFLLLTTSLSGYAAEEVSKEQREPSTSVEQRLSDSWLRGKVEMALLLNRYLNSFKIDTHVDDHEVTLSGFVESDIDRDLAEQIVLGIRDVSKVNNDLKIDPEESGKTETVEQNAFLQRVQDVTLTARVKSKLVLNNNVKARAINVDTKDAVVTLRGKVGSPQERDLAIQIAKNTSDVLDVASELKVEKST